MAAIKRKRRESVAVRTAKFKARWEENHKERPPRPDLLEFYRFQKAYPPKDALDGLERFILVWHVGMVFTSDVLYGNGTLLRFHNNDTKKAIWVLQQLGVLQSVGRKRFLLLKHPPGADGWADSLPEVQASLQSLLGPQLGPTPGTKAPACGLTESSGNAASADLAAGAAPPATSPAIPMPTAASAVQPVDGTQGPNSVPTQSANHHST